MPKDGSGIIGVIHWYGSWRRYCFSPNAKTVYEHECLRAIADFCEQKTREHKKPKPFETAVEGDW